MRAPPRTVWLVIAGVVVGVMWACPCFGQNPTDGTGWGQALALLGDTAMIGFPNADYPEFPSAGCVDTLTRNGDAWTTTERRFSDQPATSGYFAYALSRSDSDLIIGAFGEDAPGEWDAGAAYVVPLPQPHRTIAFNGSIAGHNDTF